MDHLLKTEVGSSGKCGKLEFMYEYFKYKTCYRGIDAQADIRLFGRSRIEMYLLFVAATSLNSEQQAQHKAVGILCRISIVSIYYHS